MKYYDFDIKTDRINKIGEYLKRHFGKKTVKLSIDGGFTCPNRDGSKGRGGCIFCSSSGSGDFASDIETQIELLSKKWTNCKYIAYFQNHTNTYAPAAELRSKFYEALANPNISGLAISTRPDCFSEEIYELLNELNQKTFLWVELGLQTIHKKTATLINRCSTLDEYDEAVKRLTALNINVVTHLILGLPNESRDEMLTSVSYVANSPVFGMKLHMLNVVRGSQMETLYTNYIPFKTMEEYINLVVDALEIIPPHITIHRLGADAPRPTLIAPEWSYKKRSILNGIDLELKRRNSFQGKRYIVAGPNLPSL